jgi:uncharacterized protein YbaP (TraB family)
MLKTIRRCVFAILWVCACVVNAAEQTNCPAPPEPLQLSPEQARAALLQAQDHGFLWRIKKDERTSYLYGTIHVAKKDWIFPGPKVLRSVVASDTVALELDMLDPDIQSRLSASVAAAKGAALPEPLAKRVQALALSLCVPYDSLVKLIPELQIATLTMLTGRRDGLEAAYAIDFMLAGMGHGANKTVVSLETPESQLQALQMGDAQQTAVLVRESLDELQSERARLSLMQLAQVWAHSDYEQIAHYFEWCECVDSQVEREFMKRLLDDRNPGLAQKVDALHRSGKQVFAAVGSLHLVGPNGLPALMEKMGYQVEQVDFTAP